MSWAKVDDHANEHHKLLEAGAEACWLWTCGLMYANRQPARDGRIPEPAVAMLYPFKHPKRLAEKLVAVGLWERTETGYQIHEFTFWNQTKEQREATLAKGRERAARSYENRKAKNANSSPPSSLDSSPGSSGEESVKKTNSSGSTPTPIPLPKGSNNPPTQDLTGHGSDAAPAGGGDGSKRKIPCPPDLDLTEGQKSSLEMSPGIPRWAIDRMVGEARSALLPKSDLSMPLESWHVYLSKMICARWSDPAERPRKSDPAAASSPSNGWSASELGIAVGGDD
jgi:hypothetical protein